MDKLAQLALNNARFTWLLIVSIFTAGFAVYATQPRQEDPEITIRNAQVICSFPGLSPERVEELITQPVEEAIKQIPEIEDITSVSMSGRSIVTPVVADRYMDMEPIWSELRNKMDDLRGDLPSGTQGPFVNDDYGRLAVVTLALTGEEYSLPELNDMAEAIRDELNKLPLVARVDLYGTQEERIYLEFDQAFLAQFGLSASSLVTAINSQNIVLPGGTVNAAGQRIVIEPSGDFQSLDDLRNLAIATNDGGVVYLRDLARIERGIVDPASAPAYYNNRPAIVLGISMVSKSNVVQLGKQVNEQLLAITPRLPAGMSLDTVIFQPDLVQESVSAAVTNLMQTMAVVLVVVMLFLKLRTGLIVGSMIPLTMMLTLIGMSVMEIELHRISIAAIIVALGLLVDNGVVVAEDVQKRLELGQDRLKAVLGTPKQLAVPLLTSSATTIFAFLPLVLIEDGTGEFLRSLGQVLAIALLSSWLVGITIVPAFCYWFLPKKTPEPKEESYDAWPYQIYKRIIGLLLKWRLAFVVLMVVLLVLSGQLFSQVKQRSLGPSERNQFTVYLDLPAAADVSETQAAASKLQAYLLDEGQNPEVTDVLAYVGGGGPRFFLALSPNDPQPNKAFLVVNTETNRQINDVMARIERFIINDLPQATGRADILFLGPAPLGTVELRLTGPDTLKLQQIASKLQGVYHSVEGTGSIRNDWEDPTVKIRVEVDQDRARRAQVTSEEVARTLSAFFDGEPVTDYREGDKVIPVVLRTQASDRAELDRLRGVEVYSAARGEAVPLIQIADFKGMIEPSRVRRYNQQRAITVAGKNPSLTAVELYAAMGPALGEVEIPPGYAIELEGEIKGAAESNAKLMGFAPHAMFLIVLVLVLQFNSFRRPAVILLTIPLVFIGAVVGLYLANAFFDFTAMLGLFSLAGIIINNGIVMIEQIDLNREQGKPVNEAIVNAALARARPIIMTTITTVVGLLPLALFGGEFWYGMAVVIMAGLTVGTVLTLGVVPVLYSLMFREPKAQA